MYSIKPSLLNNLKIILQRALFQFKVQNDHGAIESLSRGERIISILKKYDSLYPNREYDSSGALEIWKELQIYLEEEKKVSRDEFIHFNIQKDFLHYMKKKRFDHE